MTKKEVIIERIGCFLSGVDNAKVNELESNDEFIVIEAERELVYDVSSSGMRDAWNDFKDVLRLLRENKMHIEYEDNECPSWDLKSWQIAVNIPKSYIKVIK